MMREKITHVQIHKRLWNAAPRPYASIDGAYYNTLASLGPQASLPPISKWKRGEFGLKAQSHAALRVQQVGK